MNSSPLDDMIAAVAAQSTVPSIWDSFPVPHALRAYQTYLETKKNKMLTTPDNTKLILAGVQACSLASQALRISWKDPLGADARVTVALAHAVLESWGVTFELKGLSPETDLSTPVPATPVPATLVWPPVDRLGRPLNTVLPDVYRENYYHARESMVVIDPTDTTHGYSVHPEHRLVLREAYWNEESLQWRMQFSNVSMPGQERFWIDHCKVRVGEEIPKVIDAATQARSSDSMSDDAAVDAIIKRGNVEALARELFSLRCGGKYSPFWLDETPPSPETWARVAQVAFAAADAFFTEANKSNP